MADYSPQPHQQWKGGDARTPMKSVIPSILLSLLIALPLSIFLLASQAYTIHVLNENLIFGRYVQFADLISNARVVYLNKAPTDIMIATSVITVIFACVSALGFWELRVKDQSDKGAKHQSRWAIAISIIALLNLAMVVACMVVTFLAGRELVAREIKRGGKVVATREAWICGLEKWNGDWAVKVGAGCWFARAGRWSLIPLVVCSCALVGVGMWHIGKRGGLRWLCKKGDRDDLPEFGKSVYEG